MGMDGSDYVNGDEKIGAAYCRAKRAGLASLIVFVLVVAAVSFVSSWNGSIAVAPEAGSNALGIAWNKQTIFVNYADISSVRTVDTLEPGTLVSGLEDDAVCAGVFRSETYGEYSLYINKAVERYIVVQSAGGTFVLNGPTVSKTESVYHSLVEMTSGQ